MSADVVKRAEEILSNNDYLKEFAAINELSPEASKALLERLMREPVVSEKVEEFVFSGDSSPDLKGYYSGEEKGYSRGHEAGFAKGAAMGVVATLSTIVVGGLTLYLKFKK